MPDKIPMSGDLDDRGEIEHGFWLIRKRVEGRLFIMTRDKKAGEEVLKGTFRDDIVNYVSYLCQGRFNKRCEWPSVTQMAMAIPAMRDSQADMPLSSLGYELMDLYDAAVLDAVTWPVFHQKLDEFERLLTAGRP
jgi:hypothetical protein